MHNQAARAAEGCPERKASLHKQNSKNDCSSTPPHHFSRTDLTKRMRQREISALLGHPSSTPSPAWEVRVHRHLSLSEGASTSASIQLVFNERAGPSLVSQQVSMESELLRPFTFPLTCVIETGPSLQLCSHRHFAWQHCYLCLTTSSVRPELVRPSLKI